MAIDLLKRKELRCMSKRVIGVFIAMCMLFGSVAFAASPQPRVEDHTCPNCGTHMTLHVSAWEHWGSKTKNCPIHGNYTSYVSARRYTYTCSNCGYSYQDKVEWSESGCPDC